MHTVDGCTANRPLSNGGNHNNDNNNDNLSPNVESSPGRAVGNGIGLIYDGKNPTNIDTENFSENYMGFAKPYYKPKAVIDSHKPSFSEQTRDQLRAHIGNSFFPRSAGIDLTSKTIAGEKRHLSENEMVRL